MGFVLGEDDGAGELIVKALSFLCKKNHHKSEKKEEARKKLPEVAAGRTPKTYALKMKIYNTELKAALAYGRLHCGTFHQSKVEPCGDEHTTIPPEAEEWEMSERVKDSLNTQKKTQENEHEKDNGNINEVGKKTRECACIGRFLHG